MLYLGIITLTPQMLDDVFKYGIIGRAVRRGLVKILIWNLRDFASGRHRKTDAKSYGGGPGMVMMFHPLAKAIEYARRELRDLCQCAAAIKTVYLSPQGRMMHQVDLQVISNIQSPLIFVAGRYEGIDERVISTYIDEEWSLGDFVLSAGEFAVMALVDAVVRLLPGSLGNARSAMQDSFVDGLLDYPHYTQPVIANNLEVPKILLSGNHQQIAIWRRQQALGRTRIKRPDLLKKLVLSDQDQQLLDKFEF